jgi:tRNA(adenine34) deaminase
MNEPPPEPAEPADPAPPLRTPPTSPEPDELDERMMRRALELAREAGESLEVPVGAVVYRDERILGEGFNLRETHQDPTAHAEIIALRQAAGVVGSWRLSGCRIAVTLEPCPMCAGALVNARLEALVYAADDPKMGCVRTIARLCDEPRFNHRLRIRAGVLAEPARELLRAFFEDRRRGRPPAKPLRPNPSEGATDHG